MTITDVDLATITRACCSCKQEKPLTEYHRDRSKKYGRSHQCKDCATAKAARYYKENPDRVRAIVRAHQRRNRDKLNAQARERYRQNPERATAIKRKYRYGVDEADFDRMVEEQDGRCASCGDPTEKFHVDHDHGTGAVRELLCASCNQGLGQFKDDPRRLRLAADYLDRHASIVTLHARSVDVP